MKKLFTSLLLLATLVTTLVPLTACKDTPTEQTSATTQAPTEEEPAPTVTLPLKVMAFNMRYDTKSHALLGLDVRGKHFMEIIEKYDPDSIGLCEATNDWMNFLRSEMRDRGYAYVGVGRDSGQDSATLTGTGNEHTPVFYKKDKFNLLDSGNFWLSTTPDKAGTRSWDSSCTRICTWVVLEEKETGLVYVHLATHLDHVSFEAQYNAVRVIQMKMDGLREKYGDVGMVLSGDFNAVAFDSTNASYRPLTYNYTTSFMNDSLAIAKKVGVKGSTTNGYTDPVKWENGQSTNVDMPAVDTKSSAIDYIFLSKGLFRADYYTVVNDTFTFDYEGTTYHNHPVSDHYGVYAELTYVPGESEAPNENRIVDVKAKLSSDLPASLTKLTNLVETASITSGLNCQPNYTTASLKTEEGHAQLYSRLEGGSFYWELTTKLSTNADIAGISLQNATSGMPNGAECFVSANGTDWMKVGKTYFQQMSAGERVTWTLNEVYNARYVKIVLLSCSANAKLASISVYGTPTETPLSPTIDLSPVSGPKSGASEGFEKLIDGKEKTKFYMNIANDSMFDLVFKSEEAGTAKTYTFTTANDNEKYGDRLPLAWVIYASTDGNEWVVIDTVTEPGIAHKNYTTYSFEIDNPGEYSYYKLSFTLEPSGKMQFSEFVLYR